MKKALAAIMAAGALTLGLSACGDSPADVVSRNLSTEADYFNVMRRIVFYNGITGKYLLEIDGLCSLGNYDNPGQLSVTCKTGAKEYKKHFLGLSDNVTYFVQQLEGKNVNPNRYKVMFNPIALLPDIGVNTGQP